MLDVTLFQLDDVMNMPVFELEKTLLVIRVLLCELSTKIPSPLSETLLLVILLSFESIRKIPYNSLEWASLFMTELLSAPERYIPR